MSVSAWPFLEGVSHRCAGFPRTLQIISRLNWEACSLDCLQNPLSFANPKAFGCAKGCAIVPRGDASHTVPFLRSPRALPQLAPKGGVQADVDRHAFLDCTFRSICQDHSILSTDCAHQMMPMSTVKKGVPHIVAACCHHHVEIKADATAQRLSFVKWESPCLSIAPTDAKHKQVALDISRFRIRRVLTLETYFLKLGEFDINAKINTGNHVAAQKKKSLLMVQQSRWNTHNENPRCSRVANLRYPKARLVLALTMRLSSKMQTPVRRCPFPTFPPW